MQDYPKKRVNQGLSLLAVLSLTLLFAVVLPIINAAPVRAVDPGIPGESLTATTSPKVSHRLIVQLESPSLAEMAAVSSFGRAPNGEFNVQSVQAQAYVAQIQVEQATFATNMAQALPGASVARYVNELGQPVEAIYQIVFNGMAVDAGAADPAQARLMLQRIPGVKAVFLDFAHEPDMYASLPLINAAALWNNTAIGGQANAGAGVKVASMDGGIHHDAPMFDGTGFSYPPGWPAGGLGDAANNNGKIIASRAYFRSWDPPTVGDENTWPGTWGTSHGVHTASTAAGNSVVADYLDVTETVSGVAPGAWVMSYRVFYNSVTGDGSFYTIEGLAALEDIVADGADVLNNSWGGGPSSAGGEFDPLDQALINVANAGVFVSMATGNAGPGNGTTDHPSGDYINVAASTTGGAFAAGRLNVIAPTPASPTLQNMPFDTASFGESLPERQIFSYTYIPASSVDPGNADGCDPWVGAPFAGGAAVIQRGACDFSDKVYYAQEAGAEFVVIYNNAGDGTLNMGCSENFCWGEITISSIFIGQANGEAIVAWYNNHGAASALEINTLIFQAGNDPDVIADFSSRGPGVGNVLKPDIAAPGVNILAQGYTPGVMGEDRHLGYGVVSGTSMAAPHVAGAAALLRQIHPTWSNAYIKSALMSTARYMDVYNHDGSPAQPLDMGAGRLDLTHVADPGVILDPPSLSFGSLVTGTVKTMTVAVTSVAAATETYDLSTLYTGNGFAITQTATLPGFTVTPAAITLDPAETKTITITFDPAAGRGIGDNQGYLLLTGDNGHDAHLPAWGRVNPLPDAEVLIIDNDFSPFGLADYLSYYTGALDELGITYDVWDADVHYDNPTTIPDAATLSQYQAIIYFTGDNFYKNGDFAVQTPLTALDMDRLTEYANQGGIVITMGQDASSVMDNSFFQQFVLGGIEILQDSVTNGALPELPVVPVSGAPRAFGAIFLDLSDAGDGAANQYYIDELRPPQGSPGDETGVPSALLKYPGPFNEEDGVVAFAHRDQPSLEAPGIAYYGRSIYTAFGLEGVNNTPGYTGRDELLKTFLNWAMDEPTVTIAVSSGYTSQSQMVVFEANLTSNTGGTASSYRWDFGDGTDFVGPYDRSGQAAHDYEVCGTYTVRVEATDSWGNRTIGSLDVDVTEQCVYQFYFPLIFQGN